jgi:hypothetical protein
MKQRGEIILRETDVEGILQSFMQLHLQKIRCSYQLATGMILPRFNKRALFVAARFVLQFWEQRYPNVSITIRPPKKMLFLFLVGRYRNDAQGQNIWNAYFIRSTHVAIIAAKTSQYQQTAIVMTVDGALELIVPDVAEDCYWGYVVHGRERI